MTFGIGIGIGHNNAKRKAVSIARGYYVDANGDDSNDGLTPATAIKTLTRVNSLPFTTTRKVFFKRGQSWIGAITLNESGTVENPVIFDSYGTGALPVIEGSTEINGWTLHQGNIYKASLATSVNQLFVNNDRMQAARFPAVGFATVTTAPSTSSLTCDELDGVINHTGAKCLIHSSSYGLDTKDVTASVSKTLTLSAVPFGNVDPGEKFILVGKLEYLTAPGQWYYDAATQTVYLWKTDGNQPAAGEVRGSIVDYGFVANNKSYFQVRNIEFDRQKVNGIHLTGCSNFNVNNVSVNYPDAKGIRDSNSSYAVYYNNTVRGANHLSIESYTTNSTFIRNLVYDTCLFNNLGHSGIGSWYMGSAIYVEGDNNVIDQNRVDEVGYNGIHYNGKNYVYRNFVSNFCRTKNDGGAIYTSAPVTAPGYAFGSEQNKGSEIKWNICLYGHGITTTGTPYAEGVYLDESSGGVIVEYNTVGYLSGRGIFDHKGNNHVQRNNILYRCETGLYISKVGDNNEMTNNIVYAGPSQIAAHLNALTGVPDLNNNLYISHYNSALFKQNWGGNQQFASWKTNTGQDAASSVDESALPEGYSETLLFNPGATSKRFWLNAATNVINDVTKAAVAGEYIDIAAHSAIIVTGLNVDCILDYQDSVPPVITDFALPETADSLTININSPFAPGATGYVLTEENTAPLLTAAGWTATPPGTYTFASPGIKTLYAWARDAAGNISAAASDTVTVNVPFPVPNENIIGLWNFNETEGTVVADTKGTNNGTATGTTIVGGKLGNARQFNGTSDKVSMARPALFNVGMTNDFSISFWGKIITNGTYKCFVEIGVDNDNYTSLFTDGQSRLNVMMRCAGTLYQKRVSSGIVTLGAWHHIAFTWKAATKELKFYVNGAAYATDYADYLPRGGAVMTVGAAGSNRYLNGEVDQVILSNTVLNQIQVTDLFNSGNGRSYNEL